MGIVDFDKLEIAIRRVEELMDKYNPTEKELIINNILQRMAKEKESQRAKDIVGSFGVGKIMEKFKRDDEDEALD